jgi:helicase SWR1
MNGHSYSGSVRKKRRLGDDEVSDMPPPSSIPNGRSSKRVLRNISQQLSVSSSRATKNSGIRASRHDQLSISYSGQTGASSPTKSGITRIKLIVRKPPPLISHPRQRPPAPRFGSCLKKFLSSYTTINDQDFSEEALEHMARNDSIILDRIDDFRRRGRLLLLDFDGDSGSAVMSTATGTTHKRGPDIWDHIVEEVVARAHARRNGNGGRGKQVAAQIARSVQGYWDGHALREDKAKAQEERRLRALAKATIKMVTAEWKKAVFVRFTLFLICRV